MSFELRSIQVFEKQAKRLLKKVPSLKQELRALRNDLIKDPMRGIPLGNNCYKIRLAIASKGKGKSGGARIITHVVVMNKLVYLLNIYDKSEQADLPSKELDRLVRSIHP
jgi:mRNA-degrading endonuclease RelE of RelBE toxin-antitoxin system